MSERKHLENQQCWRAYNNIGHTIFMTWDFNFNLCRPTVAFGVVKIPVALLQYYIISIEHWSFLKSIFFRKISVTFETEVFIFLLFHHLS